MKWAYIFDFDGVLANSMEAHYECYRRAMEEVNVPLPRDEFYALAGMPGREQIVYFAEKVGLTVDAKEVYARKREIWDDEKPKSEAIECNIELFRLLQQAGHPVAVASGSSRPSILPAMEQLGITVDVLVTSADYTVGKPDPELFLIAAERLGVPPDHCIVVEDSEIGIEAAHAAGMKGLLFTE
ncbi:MAG: HAD family phosphatase [Candidatus Brocadiia bacterium]|jgi:HAD superfamily hydrolase (TIGR01509 family)|nr:HAD family phosphatase [Candidatus Brocadiia bacterium]